MKPKASQHCKVSANGACKSSSGLIEAGTIVTTLDCLYYCSGCQRNVTVLTDTVRGDVICKSCGIIIISRILDERPEWREFTTDDRGISEFAARSSYVSDDSDGDDSSSPQILLVGGPEELRNSLQSTICMTSEELKAEMKFRAQKDTVKSICHRLSIPTDVQVIVITHAF
jgi:transcription initiation factor TFIIIB Brf1 subunit/transcription initiation factor TFIIB